MKPKSSKPQKSNASYDKCQTPIHALDPLWKWLDDRFDDPVIWESALGEGYLAQALCNWNGGTRVITSDIELGEAFDFFSFTKERIKDLKINVQITNPPYSIKYKWLAHSYALEKPFCLLLPLETLGAKSGQKLFREHGMQLIVMDKRINFKMPNLGWSGKGAQFPTAWFTWGMHLPRDIMYYSFEKEMYL